jgi:hypothetical protein
MRFERALVPAPGGDAVPRLGGASHGTRGFLNDIVGGFAEAYELAARSAERLLGPQSPLLRTAALVGRFAFRPTVFYGELLHQEILAASGQHAVATAALLERSAVPIPMSDSDRQKLIAHERTELSRASIPRFVRTAGDLEIGPLGLRLHGWVAGNQATRHRLGRLDAPTLDEQLLKIRDCLEV